MINIIIDFSIKNKFIIGILSLALVGGGIFSIMNISVDAVPDITNNQVQIITQSSNLGTQDIEQFITYPIEIAMSNLPQVEEIRSISRFGLSVVTIVFSDDMGVYLSRQLVAEKLSEVQDDIPKGFGKPTMGPISTGLGEIYQYTLEVEDAYKEKYDVIELRTIQDWIVKRQMSMIPGVIEINSFGGGIKQYEVAIQPEEMVSFNITTQDILTALEKNNANTGGAYIEHNHKASFIRGEGLIKDISDIEQIVVSNENGIPIKIKDVAKIKIGNKIRYGALTKNGNGEAVGGLVLMLKGENSGKVIKEVKKSIEQIQKSLPQGVSIKPFLDRSKLISSTSKTVAVNLIEGGIIVIFILILLLGNWRGGLVVASTIPLTLFFALILMQLFGVSANLMSLGAIDFGILVDGSVIIVETTVLMMYQYLKKNNTINKETINSISALASKKMMNIAFFGQLIILIVFLPIFALEGIEGKMFKPMAYTFIFAMIGAMILCLTYVPMMSSLIIKTNDNDNSLPNKFINWVKRSYRRILVATLRKGKRVIFIGVTLFIGAVILFSRIGGEFIPRLDEGDLAFHAILKPGSSLTETINTTTKAEQILKTKFPEVIDVISRIGVADVPTDPMPMDIADVFVILKSEDQWETANSKEELIDKMKKELHHILGLNTEFTQPIELRFNELLTGVREDIAIKIFGEDLDMLTLKATELEKLIKQIPGVADTRVEATTGLPQITIKYDRYKISQYGLSIEQLNNTLQTAFAGKKSGVVFEGEKRFDLVVRLKEENRSSMDDIKNLFINTPNNFQIPLKEVANISYESAPMQISRDNTNRRTYVGLNIRGRDVKSVVQDIQKKIDENFKLPAGYYIRYDGTFKNLQRAEERLSFILPIALLLIFILIFFALKSFIQTVMIYIAIPMAAIGGVFSLWLRDMSFSISAGIGFIVLFGVVVLNGLVLVNGFNELKTQGTKNLQRRILKGTDSRIRPIMLTALTDILGFLPMAISTSAGAEVQRPLATVVIGGLITATFLTLVVLPILYQWIESGVRFKWSRLKTSFLIIFLLPLCASTLYAQEKNNPPSILLEEAVSMSKKNHPLLKNKQTEINKQNTLRTEAYDFGTTYVFTAAEEMKKNIGVITQLAINQQNINLLGIPAKIKLQKQKISLAKTNYRLTVLQLEKQVKESWSKAFLLKKRLSLYKELDSMYEQFGKAIEVSLEVENISKLEYISTKSQRLQIKNKLQQIDKDYEVALQQMNLWLVSDTIYVVPDSLEETPILELEFDMQEHPEYLFLQKKEREAQLIRATKKSELLPKFNIQAGMQSIDGMDGFYSYQAGLSIPLLSAPRYARIKVARLEHTISKRNLEFMKNKLLVDYQQALKSYQKWKESWGAYDKELLPIAQKQREGALITYKEGAISYIGFTQLIQNSIQVELDALEALENYLNTLFKLQYYTL